MIDACTFILRAETGPCEECGVDDHDWRWPATQHVVPHPDSEPGNSYRHPYIGPRLGVCGRDRWLHELRTDSHGFNPQREISDHAFTIE